MEVNKESILTGYPNVISFDCTQKIMEQMQKNICKIKIDGNQGTGFFCKIPFPNKDNMLPVLITNNHIIKQDILFKNDEIIKIKIKNDEKEKKINLNDRKKYTNEKFDITIIELKPKDEINDFMELDEAIINDILNNKNENADYIDRTVYIIQYPEGMLSVSYGIVQQIYEDKPHDFTHICSTKGGSSGSPIININNKIIGIHKEGTNKKFNKGTFLNYPIKDFIKNQANILPKNIEHQTPSSPFPIPKKNSTRENFSSKPLIGLQNVGATCNMNATLQCLCNIEKFIDYFKYNDRLNEIVKNDNQNNKLCTSFKNLIENLFPELNDDKTSFKTANKNLQIIKEGNKISIKSYYAPFEFKNKISKMDYHFQGIQAIDAKYLINFLLMTLHSELNKESNNQNEKNFTNSFEDKRNKQLILQNFISNFMRTHCSIISDLFFGVNYNVIECSNCKTHSFDYQIYYFLYFPLEEVRKFKLSNKKGNFNFNFGQNEVNIYDCFEFESKINFTKNDNTICNYCKTKCPSSKCTILATGPEILIIRINRGKGIEFNAKLDFTPSLDLSNYIEFIETGIQYELIGVITHLGPSIKSGHYIAYCKEYFQNNWLKFNDAMVEPVKDFKKEVIDADMPYLLFYKKVFK